MNLGATERFRRIPEAIPAARLFLRRWLPAQAAWEGVDHLVLAAAEAMNNALLHAAGDDFLVTVTCHDDCGGVVITDAGNGFVAPAHPAMPSAEDISNRGLALMYALVDHAAVTSTPAGTTVALVHRFHARPAAPTAGGPAGTAEPVPA
jgi:anti-sigma regulatory factor (Ser/Thr protein kinase)